MANTGNIFPGTGENNAGIGATAWVSPGNIVSDNATDSTCTAAASSQYLVARNFNFASVPTNATIAGIVVRIEASESSTGAETLNAKIQDDTGALVGDTKTASINGTSKTVYTYGTTSDVWTSAPTGNKVHDADWGVRFWYTTAHNIAVDYVTMALEYTVPGPGIATQTNTALGLGKVKSKATGVATEADTARALSLLRLAGRANETDSALALGKLKRKAADFAQEMDHCACIRILVTKATEADAAQSLAWVKVRATGTATETDGALALSEGGGTEIPVGRADDTAAALALVASKVRTIGAGSETESSLALARIKVRLAGVSIESDTAFQLSTGDVIELLVGRAENHSVALRRPCYGGIPHGRRRKRLSTRKLPRH